LSISESIVLGYAVVLVPTLLVALACRLDAECTFTALEWFPVGGTVSAAKMQGYLQLERQLGVVLNGVGGLFGFVPLLCSLVCARRSQRRQALARRFAASLALLLVATFVALPLALNRVDDLDMVREASGPFLAQLMVPHVLVFAAAIVLMLEPAQSELGSSVRRDAATARPARWLLAVVAALELAAAVLLFVAPTTFFAAVGAHRVDLPVPLFTAANVVGCSSLQLFAAVDGAVELLVPSISLHAAVAVAWSLSGDYGAALIASSVLGGIVAASAVSLKLASWRQARGDRAPIPLALVRAGEDDDSNAESSTTDSHTTIPVPCSEDHSLEFDTDGDSTSLAVVPDAMNFEDD
jgi:hypothetical protein